MGDQFRRHKQSGEPNVRTYVWWLSDRDNYDKTKRADGTRTHDKLHGRLRRLSVGFNRHKTQKSRRVAH